MGFIDARSSRVTMPRVAGTSLMWRDTTSLVSNKASLLGTISYPAASARASDSERAHTCTFIPNALPYPATTAPMRP